MMYIPRECIKLFSSFKLRLSIKLFPRPEVAVYMAGVGNTYGHPHPETIAALQSIGTKIYGTDINGTVSVTTNGTGYFVRAMR